MDIKIDMKDLAKKALIRFKNDDEEKSFEKDLTSILKMIDTLPITDGEAFVLSENNAMTARKDEIKPSIKREKLLENAPVIEAGCFSVPKVMEE